MWVSDWVCSTAVSWGNTTADWRVAMRVSTKAVCSDALWAYL